MGDLFTVRRNEEQQQADEPLFTIRRPQMDTTIQGPPELVGPPEPEGSRSLIPTGIRVGGTAAGLIGGSLIGQPLLGSMVGGGVGEVGAQAYEMAEGTREKFNPLTIGIASVGSAATKAIPSTVKSAGIEALRNALVTQATSFSETGAPASAGATALSAGIGAGGGAIAGRLASRQAAREAAIAQARAGQEAPPFRTTTGEPTPLIGPQSPRPVDIQPAMTPQAGQGDLILPGPIPNPSARIVSPSGQPFPDETEELMRGILTRRGVPTEEVERLIRETAPAEAAPLFTIRRPRTEIRGQERTAGQELLAKEAQAPLEQGVLQAVSRRGPQEQGPIVLPFRTEAEARMSPSVQPLSASEQKTQLADFERSVLQAVKQRGPQEENPIILPLRAEDLRSLTQTLERNRMTEEVGGPIEGPPGTFTLRTPQGDQVSLSIPDAPPGWTQKGFAAVQAEREIRDNMKEEAVRVLGLRQKYDSLQTATEDGLRLMETNPTAGRELLEDVDLAGSSSAYTKLFRDQIGGARQAVMFALGRAGVGGLVGYTQGETPEERLRNAALVAGIGAAASPALARAGGRKLSEFFTKKPPQATTPVEAIAQELGKKARAITDEMLGTREKIGDYTQAHEVADQAWKHLDELRARAHEIDPNNRLYKVVDQIVFPEGGPDSAKYKGTIRGAGQVLQRLSALAQELNRRADAGDVDAARLRDILYPEMTAGQRVMNFWRGSLVGKIATQVRNAGDQGAILGSTILDRLFTGTIAGLRQGKPLQGAQQALTLGSVAARRFKDSIAQAVHLAAKEPDTLDTILNHHDEFSQRLLEKPEGLQGPLGTYLRTINKFNEVQENWYRRAHAEAELINGLRRAGIDPDHAFRNPGMIPDDVLEKSLSEALKGTMQGQPRGTSLGFLTSMGSNPSNALLREVSDIFRRNPVLYGIAPFPRYMANRLQYVVDHSPVGLAKLATENTRRGMLTQRLTDNEEVLASLSAGKTPLTGEKLEAAIQRAEQNIQQAKRDLVYVDTPAETIGKVATGLTLSLAAGVALRHPDIAGEHWWEVKAGDTRLDMRPFSTMAGFMFLGELGRQYVTQGEITMSASDIAQGLAVLGTRAGIGLTLMDMVSGRGDVSWEGVSNLLADLAGMFGAGFFNPVSQTKDIAATIEGMTSEGIPPEAIQREFRDDWQTRLLGPTLNQFPFASRTLPERASSTSADPVHFPYPLAHFFGANISTPNPVEQEIGRLGIPREAVYPRVENRADARAIAERMGPVVEREGQRLINDVRFRSQRDAGREELLRDLLAKARGYGERQLGGTDPQRLRDIKMNRLPEHRQELLRERMLRR